MGQEYKFSICHVEQGAYKTHEETAKFRSRDDAYLHFRRLLKKFNVGGSSYYLCQWGVHP